jgi:hypothetical protein
MPTSSTSANMSVTKRTGKKNNAQKSSEAKCRGKKITVDKAEDVYFHVLLI